MGSWAMGEHHPTDGIVIATTQLPLLRPDAGGSELFGPDFKVYVVGVKGDFTDVDASPPAGADFPKGHFWYAVVYADTLEVSDFGIGEPFDLAHYGPHIPLDLQSG